MKDGQVHLQFIFPALKTEAALTATMTNAEEIILDINSSIKVSETSSSQQVIFKYGTLLYYSHQFKDMVLLLPILAVM